MTIKQLRVSRDFEERYSPVSKLRWVLALAAAFAGGAVITSSTGHTFASFSDFQETPVKVGAGTWGPTIPAECSGMSFDSIVYVGPGITSFSGTNKNELIFANNLGDTIDGGNGDDCIVGGTGNDTLSGGNGKDVILGGPGNDTINGDNAPDVGLYGGPGDDVINGDNGPDHVDGGIGNDTCNGGAAPDAVIGCEHSS